MAASAGDAPPRRIRARCLIVGGGPAGMLLGLQLARGGVEVVVLEKHADFLRDFRGDTVHPSTLRLLDDLGLGDAFARLPQRRERALHVRFADRMLALADFGWLRPHPWLAFVPQWDLLDLLAGQARACPRFALRMATEATALCFDGDDPGGRVAGVLARDAQGSLRIEADLVVAADGRDSVLRAQSGLPLRELGAPMDVLWFRLPREARDPDCTHAVAGRGQFMVMIHRGDYWQVGLILPKDAAGAVAASPTELQARLHALAPDLDARVTALAAGGLHRLQVRVSRLRRWHRPGLLCIGDAAHAMSPIGGVGINLAFQDAAAAGNLLGPALCGAAPVPEALLARVQRRRMLPTRLIQRVQIELQRRVVARALAAGGPPPRAPRLARLASRLPVVRALPAWLFGLGPRPERIRFGAAGDSGR
ncbi:FAD-dependent oxidoreductase [Coralloluteibacterium stylophorae]|uniref:FAD-dependent oxidoreductase n=1 Tax=Coralloluteibacterium stylophorae TaxID=1776034 RepID=A0A8J7VTP0_9GAMM|nr:FAD-dependent oxidoreductase [Coralloluteibacterium stylophorae]MBS7457968.1 FAD-dependent oxidoreductase [Coralloluteibacterium stylophorae]